MKKYENLAKAFYDIGKYAFTALNRGTISFRKIQSGCNAGGDSLFSYILQYSNNA